MSGPLTDIETRILGSLVEKQLTTPEYYPLTLNSLVAACNQKSNRDPVMSLTDTSVLSAIDPLRDRNLVYLYYGSSSRTVKYKHMLAGVYELDDAGVAVMAVLMLRGPQTLGELRERTGRLYEFSGLGEVQETLDLLSRRDEPVVVKLERQAGQKEARYAHLFSGPVEAAAAGAAGPQGDRPAGIDARIEGLETRVSDLQAELKELHDRFDEFRAQFN
ncbi:MAG: YceH family protein [Acidobacteriota bacterium]